MVEHVNLVPADYITPANRGRAQPYDVVMYTKCLRIWCRPSAHSWQTAAGPSSMVEHVDHVLANQIPVASCGEAQTYNVVL